MIIQQDILAFLWNMGEVQIDEFEGFEGNEQNKIYFQAVEGSVVLENVEVYGIEP